MFLTTFGGSRHCKKGGKSKKRARQGGAVDTDAAPVNTAPADTASDVVPVDAAPADVAPTKGGKGKKGFSHPKKGKKSRTRRGRKDFTTKKTSHVFDEGSHYVRKGRRPYRKGGKRRTAKKH